MSCVCRYASPWTPTRAPGGLGGYLMLIRRTQSSACRVGVLSSRRHRILRPKIGPDHRRDRLVIAVGIATVRRPAVVMVVFSRQLGIVKTARVAERSRAVRTAAPFRSLGSVATVAATRWRSAAATRFLGIALKAVLVVIVVG